MAQDIAQKVAYLLAQAEGTDNPHEAEAFTAKAEELMLKHSIDEAMLAGKRPGQKADPIIKERIPFTSQYAAGIITFGGAVAPTFNLKAYQTLTTGQGAQAVHYIWLVGHESDIQQATTLIKSLLIQSESAMRYWWEQEGRQTCAHLGKSKQYAARREFFFAFGSGVRSRLKELYNRVVEEAVVGTELVLRDRAKMVDDWARQNIYATKARAGKAQAGDVSARVAGYEAGRDSVGQRKVSQ